MTKAEVERRRAARIKAVVVACRQRGMDDDARRDLQLAVTGKKSLTEMSLPELDNLLNHLNGRQEKAPKEGWRFVFDLVPSRQVYGKKLYRLAEVIGQMQDPPVPVMSVSYVEGIARQMTGCDHPLRFCDESNLHKIVQAMEIHIKRHGGQRA